MLFLSLFISERDFLFIPMYRGGILLLYRQLGISYPYRLSDSFKAPAELSTFKLETLKRKTLPMGKDTQ